MIPENSISIFWEESASYIVAYSIYAFIIYAIMAAFEYHNQTSEIPFNAFAAKTAILTIFAAFCFTLSLYIVGWHSRLLGGEFMTFIVLSCLWFVLAHLVNKVLIDGFHMRFNSMSVYTIIPAFLLITPFVLVNLFAYALGSGWKN